VIRFRVQATEQEAALIRQAARKQGLSPGQFISNLFKGFGANRKANSATFETAAP